MSLLRLMSFGKNKLLNATSALNSQRSSLESIGSIEKKFVRFKVSSLETTTSLCTLSLHSQGFPLYMAAMQ